MNRDELVRDTGDCAQEALIQDLQDRIPEKKQKGWIGPTLFWFVVVWVAAGLMSVALPKKAEAQTFAPVNDSTAIILEIRNYDADTVTVFVGQGHDFHPIGIVKGNGRRIFTVPSSSLGNASSVVVAIVENGQVAKVADPVTGGQWWIMVIGEPPQKARA